MRWFQTRFFVLAMLLLTVVGAKAEDIDLFAGSLPAGAAAPNVLLIMDTGASFSASNNIMRCNISPAGDVRVDGGGANSDFTALDKTNGGVEQCALYSVVKSVAASTQTMALGVMFFNSGMKTFDPTVTPTATNPNAPFGSECASGVGGCLAMKNVIVNSTTGPRIMEWIRNWTVSGNGNYNIKAPANRGDGATMQEAWAYFNGKTGISGRDYALIMPSGAGCASKNIIYIGNNWAQQASPKDGTNDEASPLKALNGLIPVIGKRASPPATADQLASILGQETTAACGRAFLDTAENKGAYGLNWVQYMKGQEITTFSVAMMNDGCDAYYGAYLQRMGTVGGGGFFSVKTYDALVKALKVTTGQIQSVNSVFAAVSLPVSVNTQGSYLNQVYVGMFRPGTNFLPRWDGNLKQYKMGKVNGVLKLVDANDTPETPSPAINALTGFITECARSYWTPGDVDTYWAVSKRGGCTAITGSEYSDSPDGNIVEKGAQAHMVRTMRPSARTVYTCSPVFSDCSSLTSFATTTAVITQAMLNPATNANDRDALINWARGANVRSELSKSVDEIRPSVHGDIVHSRPIPVNHAAANEAPSIVVYYGGNDGMLRAVNGNRGSATSTLTGVITSGGRTYLAGEELWSFMPPEFYGSIKRLYDNTSVIISPATSSNLSTQKNYGFDGPITSFQGTVGGVSKTYVYATMRRGGRAIYAFDVTTPGSPALLWKKGCPNPSDDTGCSTGYAHIGQTWSSLKTVFATGYQSGAKPLLVTGGGYDTCEDSDAQTAGGANHACGASPRGNKVYVIDAETGDVVRAFDTVRSVIADVTIARDASTGRIRYGYTADLGGNVYRLNFTGAPADWTMTTIASLGCNTLSSCTANRKFMFAPSVTTLDNDTYNVMLGSGDREKPVEAYAASKAVTNYFFMINDKISDGSAAYTDTINCGSSTTTLCLASLYRIGQSDPTPTSTQLATKPKGWYLGMLASEQVVTSAITVFGVVTFSTHQPAVTSPTTLCKPNLGETRVYNISYKDASSANGTNTRSEDLAGDGLPPSPVAGQVTLDDGTTVPFCIGCSKDSPLEGAPPKTLSSVIQPKNRLYWYIQK
jgi:type IV pilus assembly protein PilY1